MDVIEKHQRLFETADQDGGDAGKSRKKSVTGRLARRIVWTRRFRLAQKEKW
jgi:hypothetical protein